MGPAGELQRWPPTPLVIEWEAMGQGCQSVTRWQKPVASSGDVVQPTTAGPARSCECPPHKQHWRGDQCLWATHPPVAAWHDRTLHQVARTSAPNQSAIQPAGRIREMGMVSEASHDIRPEPALPQRQTNDQSHGSWFVFKPCHPSIISIGDVE